ncbi:hypothetical protein [Pedobacter jejuensis]|uniref:Uncharacterized protein n=1 Tax=Pedobacter jejuensis TaxID=1268550 RepID=A0A3N0C094_9SPHI|nr:hypothetical protein [Pedobacter jejuensis]RNL55586.1 hypothetical protein D7004_04565 [Pedobacter jejuensis]
MKINEAKNNSSATNNGTANTANPVTADKNKVAFVNSNPVNKDSAEIKDKEDKNKVEEEQPKGEAPPTEAPKAEQASAPAKPQPVKPVMNLDSTVKVVLDLNRKIQYRNRMQTIVANLDDFVVKQEEVGEETGANSLQGCELIIRDDQGRTFSTKNANLIQQSAQFVNNLCVEKIAEIEAEIIIPA